jgi:hypothetical protein
VNQTKLIRGAVEVDLGWNAVMHRIPGEVMQTVDATAAGIPYTMTGKRVKKGGRRFSFHRMKKETFEALEEFYMSEAVGSRNKFDILHNEMLFEDCIFEPGSRLAIGGRVNKRGTAEGPTDFYENVQISVSEED